MAEKPSEAPKPLKKTLLLYSGDESFECPILNRVTGRVYDEYPPILEEYRAAIEFPVPETVRIWQNEQDPEQKDKLQKEHAGEIALYLAHLNQAVSLRTRGVADPSAIKAKRVYLSKVIRLLLRPDGLDEEKKTLIESPPDSEFWKDQDFEAIEDIADRFRRRLE